MEEKEEKGGRRERKYTWFVCAEATVHQAQGRLNMGCRFLAITTCVQVFDSYDPWAARAPWPRNRLRRPWAAPAALGLQGGRHLAICRERGI